jgi:hypothetical protein
LNLALLRASMAKGPPQIHHLKIETSPFDLVSNGRSAGYRAKVAQMPA